MSDLDAVDSLVSPDEPVPRGVRFKIIQARVPRSTVARFKRNLPIEGAITWFVRECFEEFNRQVADRPRDQINRAVADIIQTLAGDRTGGALPRLIDQLKEER